MNLFNPEIEEGILMGYGLVVLLAFIVYLARF